MVFVVAAEIGVDSVGESLLWVDVDVALIAGGLVGYIQLGFAARVVVDVAQQFVAATLFL